jgi:hypothetical protein
MRNRWSALLAALAVAGLFALPAYAGGDGEGEKGKSAKPAGDSKEAPKGKEGECKDAKASECDAKSKEACEKSKAGDDVLTVACAEEGNDCTEGKPGEKCVPGCTGKKPASDLEIVALAAVEGGSEAAKKVWAAVPAETVKNVEEARKVAFDRLIEIQKAMEGLRKDFAGACDEAKAKGKDVACDAKATYQHDVKILHSKAMAQVAAFSKVLGDSLGEGKVKELSGDCRKAGDLALAAGVKIREAALQYLKKKASRSECDDEDCDEDDCDDDDCDDDDCDDDEDEDDDEDDAKEKAKKAAKKQAAGKDPK